MQTCNLIFSYLVLLGIPITQPDPMIINQVEEMAVACDRLC